MESNIKVENACTTIITQAFSTQDKILEKKNKTEKKNKKQKNKEVEKNKEKDKKEK